jgi:GAF domain-containing protein
LALESARLYQDTQRRAANEQMLSRITANLARSLDMNVILQTVVHELGESLPVDEVSVLVGAQSTAVPWASSIAQKDEEQA